MVQGTKHEVTLTYWDGRGKAEIIRYMLAACGVPYKECVPGLEGVAYLSERKHFTHLLENDYLPMGQVPLLCMDGLKLSQSGAIVRYLAAKHGMDGSPDVYHKTQCDIIAECLRDYKADAYGAWEYWLGPDPSPERLTKLQASNGRFLPRFERQLKRNREEDGYIGGFLVGPKLTYADVYASEVLEEVVAAIPEALSAYPLTAALLEQTRAHPGIAAFLSGKDGHRKMINAAEKDIITYRANVDRALGR